MGFMSTLKSHGSAGNKNVKAKYKRTFVATDDEIGVCEITLALNTIVLDTSDESLLEEAVHGGSLKTPGGTVTYKSGDANAAEMFSEGMSETLDSRVGKAEEEAKKKPRKRSGKADQVEPSTNGEVK